MDDVADTVVPPCCIMYAFRIGCLLLVLHLSVNAGMDNPFFMGPLGKGAWHNWPRQHLVSLLGIIWYNTSRSDVSSTTWWQCKTMIANSALSPLFLLDFQCRLGLRACPLQRTSSAVVHPPIRLPQHSSIAKICPMIVCSVRRLFSLIVELQRIEQRPRHGLASRHCSVVATLTSHHAARKFSAARPINLISANDLPVRTTSSSLLFFLF